MVSNIGSTLPVDTYKDIVNTTGIDRLQIRNNTLTVSSNPISAQNNQLIFTSTSSFSSKRLITVFDISGRTILQKTIFNTENKVILDNIHLISDSYILIVESNKLKESTKFTVN